MVQEAWILSLLCPNVDEQAVNHFLNSEFRGNTAGKIKANSSSPHLRHSILPWFALTVELTQSNVGFTSPPFPQLLQNSQKQFAQTVERKKVPNFCNQRQIK